MTDSLGKTTDEMHNWHIAFKYLCPTTYNHHQASHQEKTLICVGSEITRPGLIEVGCSLFTVHMSISSDQARHGQILVVLLDTDKHIKIKVD